jgi:Ion channel
MTHPIHAPAPRSASAAARATELAHVALRRAGGMSALLVLLVCVVFLLPSLLEFVPEWHLVSDVLVVLILLSGVVAVAEHRKLALALALISLLVIAIRVLEWFTPVDLLPVLRRLSTLGAFLVLAFAVGINVFASGHAIGDRVFGAIVLYLLLGLIWGVMYAVLGAHAPDAFSGHPGTSGGLTDWIYFSFVTLTTVGYGDITPVATSARSLAMLEALTGQLYPAIIIARLVSLQSEA